MEVILGLIAALASAIAAYTVGQNKLISQNVTQESTRWCVYLRDWYKRFIIVNNDLDKKKFNIVVSMFHLSCIS